VKSGLEREQNCKLAYGCSASQFETSQIEDFENGRGSPKENYAGEKE
jgi:hypothetical protein